MKALRRRRGDLRSRESFENLAPEPKIYRLSDFSPNRELKKNYNNKKNIIKVTLVIIRSKASVSNLVTVLDALEDPTELWDAYTPETLDSDFAKEYQYRAPSRRT